MAKPHHWNDYSDTLSKAIQTIVYAPLLYIIMMPWLSLILVNFEMTPFFPGFFQAMASIGWLIASVLTFMAVLFEVLRSIIK